MSDQSTKVSDQRALDEQAVAPATKSEKEQTKALEQYSKLEDNGQLSMLVILAKHHNFISLLSPCDVVVRSVNKGEQRIRISGGIMHVKADRIIVFLDV